MCMMWRTAAEAYPQWWQRVSNRVWTIMRNAAVTEVIFAIKTTLFSLHSFLADALLYFSKVSSFLPPSVLLHQHCDADLAFCIALHNTFSANIPAAEAALFTSAQSSSFWAKRSIRYQSAVQSRPEAIARINLCLLSHSTAAETARHCGVILYVAAADID